MRWLGWLKMVQALVASKRAATVMGVAYQLKKSRAREAASGGKSKYNSSYCERN